MKKFVFSIGNILCALFCYAQNLILNPGCEKALVSNEIPDWTEVKGSTWTQRTSNPAPFEGNGYFYPGTSAVDAELRQDIDVSSLACTIDNGNQDFDFAAYVQSYNQSPADITQIIIECRNSTNSSVLYSYDSGTNNNTTSWKKVNSTISSPSGTRWLRIRLISTFQAGANNDGYYDSLYLAPVATSIPYSIDLGNDTTICTGQNITLDATTSGASYLWSDNSTAATLNISSSGKYWVEVNANSCTFSDTINILFENTPIIELGNDTSLCDGDTMIIGDPYSVTTYNWLWSDNSFYSSLEVTSLGKYWVQLTDISTNCKASDTITVTFNAIPVVHLGDDTILCPNETLNLSAYVSSGSYQWQDNSTLSTYEVTASGTYWVAVTSNGCTGDDTIYVSYTPITNVDLGNDTSLCENSTITFHAYTTSATYLWSDNSTQSDLTVSSAGDYFVIMTLDNCSDTDSVNVSYLPQPSADLGNDTSICENSSYTLTPTISNATNLLWSDNSLASSLTINSQGQYWLKAISDECWDADTIEISEIPLPTLDLGSDTAVCQGDSITLDATTSGASYLWLDNSSLSSLTVSEAGIYYASITTVCGTATDYITIDTMSCECYVYLPNTFTPNNDHLNDIFIPVYNCSFLEYELFIFNRFGERIFTSADEGHGWDGSLNGNTAEIGVYSWRLSYKGNALPKKIIKTEYGRVSLIR
jgi:gliding motility-associated-like protein